MYKVVGKVIVFIFWLVAGILALFFLIMFWTTRGNSDR